MVRRAGHYGALSLRTAKPVVISAAVGAVAQFAEQKAVESIDFLKSKWWGGGAALGVVALLLHKMPSVSHGLAGAAGYSMMMKRPASGAATGETGVYVPGGGFTT